MKEIFVVTQVSPFPVAIEITPATASKYAIPFATTLEMSPPEFEDRRRDYIRAVSLAADVPESFVRIVRVAKLMTPVTISENSTSSMLSNGAAGRRNLPVDSISVETELIGSSALKAQEVVLGLVQYLLPELEAAGVASSPYFLESPSVVMTDLVQLPLISGCSLAITWDQVLSIKVAERQDACAAAAFAPTGRESHIEFELS